MIRIPSDRTRFFLIFFNKDRIQSERLENRAETYGDIVRGSHPNLVERQAGCRPRIKSGEMSRPSLGSPPREGLDISPLLILSTTTYARLEKSSRV